MVLWPNVLQCVADSPVEVALGHVLIRIGHVVDVSICCGAVRHHGNPGSVRTDRKMMKEILHIQPYTDVFSVCSFPHGNPNKYRYSAGSPKFPIKFNFLYYMHRHSRIVLINIGHARSFCMTSRLNFPEAGTLCTTVHTYSKDLDM